MILPEKVPVLSFIQLLVIKHILHATYIHKHDVIRKIVAELDKTMDQHETCVIISTVLANGIKKYMRSTFDATKKQIIIDKIFNKLILTKFRQGRGEGECHVSYTSNSQSKYQSLVFNAGDMVRSIFQ